MLVAPDQVESLSAIRSAMAELEPSARDLAMTLLLGVGAGESVPERFRVAIEERGEALWRAGVLLPRGTPTAGATIDPRFYAAFCRVNGALGRMRLLRELWEEDDAAAHPAPTDARWDAVVVAAKLEAEPARLTQAGILRRDDLRRLLDGLGGDPARWSLALDLARASGLVRPAAGGLHGFPESKPRPLADLSGLVSSAGVRRAIEALVRVAADSWIRLDRLGEHLKARLPAALAEPDDDFDDREAQWLREAADLLHRVGVLDGIRSSDGVVAFRKPQPRPPRPPGFLLTPDREILVAPGELPGREYGRLCRLAPYHDGDVVHRHRLSRRGVAADIEAGQDDVVAFLQLRSRTGVPGPVRDAIAGWISASSRISLLTGATVVERDGAFEVVDQSHIPSDVRDLFYDTQPPAAFRVEDGELRVRFGEDPLTVRAAVGRVGRSLEADAEGWRWTIAPEAVPDTDHTLDRLRRYHDGELPGELEAAVLGAAGQPLCRVVEAVVVYLPTQAAAALRRDRVAGALLTRSVAPDVCVVDRGQLSTLQSRMTALGFGFVDE
jgi:hypothetical protein